MQTINDRGLEWPFKAAGLLLLGGALIVLTALGWLNYLLFHSLIELFSICVATTAFLVGWNVRRRMDNGFLLFITIAYAAVSVLDLAHMLSYKGMAVFPLATANVPTQLWIAARYLQALSLLVAPLFLSRPLPGKTVLTFFALIDLILLGTIFRPWPFLPAFPECYIEGALLPLTGFKVASEYIISGMLLAALGLLWIFRSWLDRAVMGFMAGSIGATVVSELFFSFYSDVVGPANMVGHLLRAVAFYLAYKALIEAGLTRPFEVLFRNVDQTRRQLVESEERFRTLAAATFEGIAITEEGRVADVNEQLLEILACKREDIIGKPVADFLPAEDRDRVMKNIREGIDSHIDHLMRWKDGVFVAVEAHGKTVAYKNRAVRVTAIRDVTERKRSEEALREARNSALRTARELARSNQELDRFANMASHDLKEPMRMVSGFMGLLKERYADKLDAKALEFIGFAVESTGKMQQVLDDLVDYCGAGRDLSIETVPVSDAVDEALERLHPKLESSGAVVTRESFPILRANRRELVQLFQHLVENAVKFTGERHPEVHIGARREAGQWHFTVRDNGIGIDSAYRDRVFMIFERLHTADAYSGSGVGLAICKKIVERQNGKIWVESNREAGSTFHFTLPSGT